MREKDLLEHDIGEGSPGVEKKIPEDVDIVSFNIGGSSTANKIDQKELEPATASFKDLFRFADTKDWLLLTAGTICACVTGALFPLFAVFFGNSINAFFPYNQDAIDSACLEFVYLAIGLGTSTWLQYSCFSISAARQVQKLRGECLRSTLKQEIAWYDKSKSSQISSQIAGDTVIIQEGMGQKLGDVIKLLCQFVAGYVIGFTKGWKMALVLLSSIPLLVISMGVFSWSLNALTTECQAMYARAGGVVEETFGGIRTTTALNAQKKMQAKYKEFVSDAEVVSIKGGFVTGASIGVMLMSIFLTYALGWWYGGKLISDRDPQVSTVGDVVKVFFAVIIGSMSIAQLGPNAKAVANALGALSNAIKILDRKSSIDVFEEKGEIPRTIRGEIVMEGIEFAYPTRPDIHILKGLDLVIPAGKTVALVGASGSGKSTIVSLLQRFYDVKKGSLKVDGIDVRDLNLRWLRGQLGLVSQEPILFSGSIAENIGFGITSLGKTASREEIIAAAKKSNAHRFIEAFPQGYDTMVGEKGVQLSGGQKQRIAIARAIIRDPAILLLDEATSALDTESERVVQSALDALLAERNGTCLVIAHRLSTIQNADFIAVFNDGCIVEQGTHSRLMEIENGVYKNLVQLQVRSQKDSDLIDDYDKQEKEAEPVGTVRSIGDGARASSLVSRGSLHCQSEIDIERLADSTDLEVRRHIYLRIMGLNKDRWHICLVGFIASLASGVTYPLWSVILTDMMNVLGIYANNLDKLYEEVCYYSVIYTVFAVAVGIVTFIQFASFTYIGEKVTSELRNMTFEATARQNIAFFDKDCNNTGAIAARLATEAKLVKSIAGETLGQLMQNCSTLVCALLIAFILGSWKISLVLCAILPILVVVSMFQSRFLMAGAKRTQDHIVDSGKMATEAISSIRTVASFGLEESLIANYYKALEFPCQEEMKKGVLGGASVGGTQLVSFLAYALIFWYGGQLVARGEINFDQTMKSLMTIMFAAMGLAQTSSFMTDTVAAKNAANDIYAIVDRQPVIDWMISDRKMLSTVSGDIELNDVYFTYPSRPDQPILRGFSVKIQAGQTVALVGESGSGKSTIISLVERFYDPDRGTVSLDGYDLRDLNPTWVRDQIGLVGQEPTLFQGTISENISLGKPGGATKSEVEEAARMANAYSFIQTFPKEFDTEVGDRGVQLSGGQKQRIAIARAIVK
eukprot:Ihof_evm3s226 gene=Ihof_evmTU3s226